MTAQTFGTVLLWLIVLAIAIVILVYILRWLYRRSTKEVAFVRTGFLGEKVVVNGGAFVIPVLHEITPVNMNVMRTVAAQMSLEEMHERRNDYASRVREIASESLAFNGLELESVAIVDLDQTSLEYFDPSNAFDAEGLTQLTESIETRRKMRNEIEQRTLVDIRNQNLDTQKKVLQIDRETEYARLEQEREVEVRRAAQRAELARERAVRDQEAEQAPLGARGAV